MFSLQLGIEDMLCPHQRLSPAAPLQLTEGSPAGVGDRCESTRPGKSQFIVGPWQLLLKAVFRESEFVRSVLLIP